MFHLKSKLMKSYYDDQPMYEPNQNEYGAIFHPSIRMKMDMIKQFHEVVVEYEILMKFYHTRGLENLEIQSRLKHLEGRIERFL